MRVYHLFLLSPVSYTHLDVYKRQILRPYNAIIDLESKVNNNCGEEVLVELELSLIHI